MGYRGFENTQLAGDEDILKNVFYNKLEVQVIVASALASTRWADPNHHQFNLKSNKNIDVGKT